MQPADNHFRSARAVPIRKFAGATGERPVDGDGIDLRCRIGRRRSSEQIFVPVLPAPIRGRGCRETGERKPRRKYVLAEAGVGVFRVERIDQQDISRLDRRSRQTRVERAASISGGIRRFRTGWEKASVCMRTSYYKVLCICNRDGYQLWVLASGLWTLRMGTSRRPSLQGRIR
jgi:hypothetical protein